METRETTKNPIVPVNINKKKISIIGSGFVGKAAGKGFLSLGHDVTFVDINTILIESLNKEGLEACNIGASCSNDRDIYVVSVLTPTINDHLDFRFIDSALASLGRVLKSNANWPLIIIRSTVPPGTVEKRFAPILEKYSDKKADKDFGIAMNPEFLREVSAEEDFMHPWIVILGSREPRVAQILQELYQPFNAPIIHMTIKEAEMMKYVHNIYNANKISFFNEMRLVAESAGVDADKIFEAVVESAEASWNKKYGIRNFGPFDGSCLPKDTLAFLNWANEKTKKKMPLLHAVIKINEHLKEKEYLGY
ncbi:MAG: Nucleotide sugar dehydrogenase [Candidatus Moranbacteria bacterium GW2011_GWE1_35_17]|nr:MAG: Nucleotide sugar dehydrogenase [Candidatus Moranbacteria bacterium GW2011_GWE1_35_17]KKP72853.1 MAG: Nucleotide sugar dehydrogenase [Candidatus Moranbacteria bacterium GW2011_GWE2_35_164]KKP84074.1 MAG: Nucleotide sugar dehydrogenase [Candidatus Moranbacteria bacterium GW2011_GWF1_35_5]KKP85116.1 MAG: Nucleotide sugar dehydrogenase [Candidatus Moranbacteria bacterium GW2011_GWF2_35_54]